MDSSGTAEDRRARPQTRTVMTDETAEIDRRRTADLLDIGNCAGGQKREMHMLGSAQPNWQRPVSSDVRQQ